MTRLLPLIVLTHLLLQGCGKTNESMFREDCWESYATIKLCIPQYDECLILMRNNCSGVFSKCIEDHHSLTSSITCRRHVRNFTEAIKKTEAPYVKNLSERITTQEERNTKMWDVSIFEHHDFQLLNFSTLSMIQVDKLPQLILSFCQCPEQLESKLSEGFFPQSRQSSIPIHFWYGGFQIFKCWKESDQYLAETLCGRQTSFLINHEWAIWKDCLENPTAFNCSIKFVQRFNKIPANSEKPLFCSVYVEIVVKLILFFENSSFDEHSIHDYKIVYTNSDETGNLIYRNDELYLFNQSNENIDFKCFDGKRTLNSYIYSLHSCKKLNQDECYEKFVKLLKDDGLSDVCVSVFMPEKNFVEQLLVLLWKHKVKIFLFGLLAVLLTGFKKLRDWIAKELGIRMCMCLTRKFDAATIYFDHLMPEDGTSQETTNFCTNQNVDEDDDDEHDEEEHGQLLPVDDHISPSSESLDANSNADPNSNNYIGDIQQETDSKTPKNNQTPIDPLLNAVSMESLVKEKSPAPKEKPKSLSAFKSLCSSFWNMSSSMCIALHVRLMIPVRNYARQKTFGSRSNQEKNEPNFSDQTELRIVIEHD